MKYNNKIFKKIFLFTIYVQESAWCRIDWAMLQWRYKHQHSNHVNWTKVENTCSWKVSSMVQWNYPCFRFDWPLKVLVQHLEVALALLWKLKSWFSLFLYLLNLSYKIHCHIYDYFILLSRNIHLKTKKLFFMIIILEYPFFK